jgi:hypothetical protein
MTMTKFLIGAAALALLATNPASAQLLGGGGGGMLGGSLGGAGGALGGMGSLGGSMGGLGRMPDTVTSTTSRTSNSARVDKSVNRHTGHVSATGSGSSDLALANTTSVAGRSVGSTGAASASGSGTMNAQLVGTDTVRSVGTQAMGTTSGAVQQTRDAGGSAITSARDYTNAVTGSAGAAGSGALSGGTGMLALAGSAAGNGAGSFNVSPGMDVADAKGRIIGTVSNLKSTSTGRIENVVMKVGSRTASLPASNFVGSGGVLVSAMGKGDVTNAAKEQSAK